MAGSSGARFHEQKILYRELNDLANRAAKGFQKLGVRPGVHVGLYLPNTPHYIIAFFGVMKAGGTVVNYSPLDAEKFSSTRSTTARPTSS
jgi:long-chain acyl-CoA synthetase